MEDKKIMNENSLIIKKKKKKKDNYNHTCNF